MTGGLKTAAAAAAAADADLAFILGKAGEEEKAGEECEMESPRGLNWN